MVVTSIVGGLGNQMFQYAAGRALALRKNTPLALDTSAFDTYSLHQGFELQHVFACDAPQIDQTALQKLIGWQGGPRARRMLARRKLAFLRSRRLAIEPHFEYWEGINDLPDDCFLSGYWQSERYFVDAADQIRKDFRFTQPPGVENRALIQQISAVNAISLHVRRGDYVSNPANASVHAVCALDYYRAAIKRMVESIPEPFFFVFSDDMDWVRAHLNIGFQAEYVDHNRGINSYNDMRLMSLCKHHIIANSSFSWWGAWLNMNRNKLIIAPRVWFNNDIDTKDLLPENWVVL